MYEITKDMAVPPNKAGGKERYPWESMSVGDSFFVTDWKNQARLSSSASGQKKRHGTRFVTRCITEGGVQGVRVWRVE